MPRTLSYQVGVLTMGRMIAYLAMFFVPMVLVRVFSVHDYGIYRQYWLLFETISGILVMAFPNSLLYYFPRAETAKEKSIYLTQTFAFLFGAGLLSCGAYGILYVVLGEGLGSTVERYLLPICLFTFFMIVARVMDVLFVAEKQVERQSLYRAASFMVQAGAVISVAWSARSLDAVIWALLGVALVKFIFALLYSRQTYHFSFRTMTVRSFREQMSYALPLGMAAIVLLLFTQTDKYIVIHFLGREAFAIYSIGAFQVPIVDLVRSSVTNVTFPLMAQYQKLGEYDQILELWRRATLKTAVIFFPIFIFLEVSAKPFIEILFTDVYAEATPVFMVYLLLFLRSTIETGSTIMVFKQNSFLFKANVTAFVVNIILSIFLFQQLGRLGIPIATVIVIYLLNVANMIKAGRLLRVPFVSLMPWGSLGIRLLTAIGPGVLLLVAYRWYPPESFVSLVAAALIYSAVYLSISFRFGFINMSEIRSIFGRTN